MADVLFEKGFSKLLVTANELPRLFLDLDPTYPGPTQADDFPAITLGWLRTGAVLQFQAVLAVLAHPQCAGEAEILLRPMLDALGHVIFIHEGVPDAADKSAATRALCLELGVEKQRKVEVLDRFLVMDEEERDFYIQKADRRVAEIQGLHARAGCTCPGRGFSAAVQTLRQVGKGDRAYGMLHDQWVWSSGAAHSFFPSRLYRPGPEGFTFVGGEVRAGFRAMLLKDAIDIMVDMGSRILIVNGVDEAKRRRLIYWAAQYVENPPLRNALRGEFD